MANNQLFKASDLVIKADFTTVKTVISPVNGSSTKQKVVLFSKWCAFKRKSLTQSYNTVGTTLEDTLVIGVRHSSNDIDKALGITIDNVDYKILDVSYDSTNTAIAYDLITIKKVTK